LYVVGAGGHAREVLDVVEAINASGARWEVVGFLAEGWGEPAALARRRVPLVELTAEAIEADTWLTIAVGEPDVRADLYRRIGVHARAATLVHPDASVEPDAELEPGVMVPAGARVASGASVGRHTHLNVNALVDVGAVLGEFVTVSPGAVISEGARLDERVFVGIGAVVARGVRVGEGARIGAGAQVTEDVPSGQTVVGVPARLLRASG
jgi:hypothetical protein